MPDKHELSKDPLVTDGSNTKLASTKTTKGDRSQAAIKAAARKVFDRDGYINARVQDIASEAGFSNGAFYRYFSDKHAVMMALMKELLDDAVAFARAPWDAGHPLDSIQLTTERYLAFYSQNSDLFKILVEASQTHPEVEAMWAEVRSSVIGRVSHMLDRARVAGLVREELDPEVGAALLTAMTDHYAYLWFVLDRMPEGRNIESISRQVTEIWSGGVFLRSAADRAS